MSLDRDFIENLIIQDICGTITPSDKAVLKDAIDKNPELWLLQQEMMRKFQTPDVQEARRQLRESFNARDIIREERRRKRARNMRRAGAITAVVGVIAFFSVKYVSFHSSSEKVSAMIAAAGNKPRQVVLQLPDGETIALDTVEQKLNAGPIAISTHSNTLSYQSTNTNNRERATLIVPPGKDYTIHLNDGSEIHLNSGTRLIFPLQFLDDRREIIIDGEAYVKVARQPGKPFIVRLPEATIQVLGTEFNVNTYDIGVQRVALVNGAVKVKTKMDSLVLKPGMEAVTTDQGMKAGVFDASEVLAWREGKYYINDATLYEVSRVLTRWYGKTVVIDNKKAGQQRFTGMIDKTQPIEVTLDGLKLTNRIDYSTDKNGVIHIK
ncbi:FecR family protein [Chitinophaga ginsengisoli]|uniref:FecR family protein n=1 Tax=Chitinophaga ginsengisoli TaxID=363837 RepID=A0A2P8G9P6_9BACT|nr:FecR domain-containing protein [Chitinophaga ginsengisoli]PSL30694.1 FecR family protein [Chitinophaga ginsengisoli]